MLRGFGKEQGALDFCLQSIVRKRGLFLSEPSTSLAGVKLLKDSNATCVMSSANNVAKKKRSKGSGRKAQGLPPRNPLPPEQHQASSNTGPAAQGCSGSQKLKSGPGKHPKLFKVKKHRTNPSSTPVFMDQWSKQTVRPLQTAQAESSSLNT